MVKGIKHMSRGLLSIMAAILLLFSTFSMASEEAPKGASNTAQKRWFSLLARITGEL
ncbi:hypothetical protein JCM19236_664 [Vibrio sp. JCM 19236]|nr:hypothetical protein JCM19236_664 [Vibrio sp. JCM 19236]